MPLFLPMHHFLLERVYRDSVRNRRYKHRRGSAAVLSVFLIGALLIVGAIAIDFAHINTSRSEVKRTADAAAMAGAWELFDGIVDQRTSSAIEGDVGSSASSIAGENKVAAESPTVSADSDIEIGYYHSDSPDTLDTSVTDDFNAVRVYVRKTEARQSAIPLFFGSITGKPTQSLESHSTAAFFRTIDGFHQPPTYSDFLDILPIALDEETWEQVVDEQTGDNISYEDGNIVSGSDGYHECSLYPTGTGSPGNRGTVDIGGSNNSTSDLRRQILYGISKQDMIDLGKPLKFDENHELTLNGDTGLSAGIKAQLAQIVGQKRIIPIFKSVSGNGNNATYIIVRFEGVRILGVKLTGPPHKKHLTIQPAKMIARHSIFTEEESSETDFLHTPVMLVD